jgi:hypothetical protein
MEHPALSNKNKLYDILKEIQQYKGANKYTVKNFWSGDSFRSWKNGIYREGILFINEGNSYDNCTIKVASNPIGKLILGCQNSCANGDPHPTLSEGEFIIVWKDGKWLIEGGWQKKASRILYDLEIEIETIKQNIKNIKIQEVIEAENKRNEEIKLLKIAYM